MKTKEQLKEFYESLSGLFEGYIQMSDKKLDNIFSSKQLLPAWKDLHNENNFILEACLFDGDRSITIRQLNDKFVVIGTGVLVGWMIVALALLGFVFYCAFGTRKRKR